MYVCNDVKRCWHCHGHDYLSHTFSCRWAKTHMAPARPNSAPDAPTAGAEEKAKEASVPVTAATA